MTSRYTNGRAPIITGFRIVIVLTLAAIVALVVAASYQILFRLEPCILCHYQRIPYVAIVVLGLLSLFPAVDGPSKRLSVALMAGFLMINSGVSFFHVGVERHLWEGTAQCGTSPQTGITIDEVRAAVLQPSNTACDEPVITVLGFSMAEYNLAACVFLTGIAMYAIAKRRWWLEP